MIKMSFKIQMSILIITIIAVISVIVYFVNKTNQHTQFAQTKALQSADFGFQAITERAIFPETGMFDIDLLQNISGKTEDGGEYFVSVIKDTISVDSIEVKIESRGVFENEVRTRSNRILLVSQDLINWVFAN